MCGQALSGATPRGPQGGLCSVHVPPALFSSGKPEKIGPALSLRRVPSAPPCLTPDPRGGRALSPVARARWSNVFTLAGCHWCLVLFPASPGPMWVCKAGAGFLPKPPGLDASQKEPEYHCEQNESPDRSMDLRNSFLIGLSPDEGIWGGGAGWVREPGSESS